MNDRECKQRRRISAVYAVLICLACAQPTWAEPTREAAEGYDRYVAGVEARLRSQHGRRGSVLACGSAIDIQRLRAGELVIERMTTAQGVDLPGALLHHWRGTAFVPGARAADFETLLRDFGAYPRVFSPEVLDARELGSDGSTVRAWMRVRQKHVLTVVMDTSYEVAFGHLGAGAGYSSSRSTRIYEIAGAATRTEHALSPAEEHGFLWRQNTYWTYEQRDGGLYMQVESVSLSRSIPAGLGWAVRPFVESVPRESLEFTLRSASSALQRSAKLLKAPALLKGTASAVP